MNMETIHNIGNANAVGTRAKVGAFRPTNVRKPLRGLENRVQNFPLKASFKEKPQLKDKENTKELRSIKAFKIKADAKEVFHGVSELKKCLPQLDSHSSKQLPSNVDDIDADDIENPQLVSIYIKDIYCYLRKLEVQIPIKKFHLQMQPEITGKMRAILVDWLIQVHSRFHLLQETLYMTVCIADRYLQADKVKRSDLQLVGVTSMFIASKYEEMYAPDIGDFVYITDNTYSKHEILKMERTMLHKLNFDLSRPLPLHFLRRNSKAGNVDGTVHALAKFLMEITLPEYDCAHLRPSLLAASALFLARKLLLNAEWTETLQFYSNYSEEEVMSVVRSMCKILVKAETSKLQAVFVKYSSSKQLKISTLPQLKSAIVTVFAAGKA